MGATVAADLGVVVTVGEVVVTEEVIRTEWISMLYHHRLPRNSSKRNGNSNKRSASPKKQSLGQGAQQPRISISRLAVNLRQVTQEQAVKANLTRARKHR